MDSFDLLLVSDALRQACIERGLVNPRVAGLIASGRTLPSGVAMEVYVETTQELTASDLGRLSREVSAIIGWPVLLWACAVGDEELLPGERVTML